MKYTDEERAIIADWPKTTEEDVKRLNNLFPHNLFFRWQSLRRSGRTEDYVELRASCCGHREERNRLQRTETPEHRALLDMLQHKRHGTCPWCGRDITAIDLKRARGRKSLRRNECVLLLHSKGNVLYADALALSKWYETDADLSGPPEVWCSSGYRFERGAVLQLDHQLYGDNPYPSWEKGTLTRKKKVQEPFKVGCISFYNHESYRIVNREVVENHPAFRYCGYFHEWQYRPGGARGYATYFHDFISYLTAYSIYPQQIELLVKAEMYRPVEDLIYGRKKWAAAMCWEEPDIRKSMQLTKPELREFMELGCPMELLEIRNYARRLGKNWNLARSRAWYEMWGDPLTVLRFLRKYDLDPDRFARYIDNFSFVDPELMIPPDTLFDIYKDYIEAAYMTGLCMEHTKVLWPDDLGAAHAAATAAWQASLDDGTAREEKAKNLKARKQKYEFEMGGLCIVFPATGAAVKREGQKLNHCVGGYAARHVKGVLSIVFLRWAAAPHQPYVTIEMHGNNIAQIHGKNNDIGGVSPRVTHKKFLDTWLKWLEDGSKRDADGKPILPKKRKAKGVA
ncbi:MAG: PcfJ domain-containing protein [Oscillospiraceae bacterium]|nr:PcfJ domain-containing protein [Oscillospiraceae bacterium]